MSIEWGKKALFVAVVAIGALSASNASAETPAASPFQRLVLGASRSLKVAFQGLPRCAVGDIDTITLELRRASDQRGESSDTEVLFSLEPLMPEDRPRVPPMVQTLSSGEISGKGTLTFDIPQVTKPVLMGFFICLNDDAKASSYRGCASKPVLHYQDVLARHEMKLDVGTRRGIETNPDEPVIDSTYFFGMLLVTPKAAYFATQGWSEQDFATLAKFGTELGSSDREFKLGVERVRVLSSLGSMPLQWKDGKLNVVLPYYEAQKCSG